MYLLNLHLSCTWRSLSLSRYPPPRSRESKSSRQPPSVWVFCVCVCSVFIIVHSGLLETWSRRARYVIAYKIIGVHLNRWLMATRFALNGHAAWISHFQLQLFQQRTARARRKLVVGVNSAREGTYTYADVVCVCPGNNQWRDFAKCDFWESRPARKKSCARFTFNILDN
jgi:hypothetical protein